MQADTFCAGQMKSEQGSYLPAMSPFRKGLCLQPVGLWCLGHCGLLSLQSSFLCT